VHCGYGDGTAGGHLSESQFNTIVIERKINTPSWATGATTHSLTYLVVTRSVGPEA